MISLLQRVDGNFHMLHDSYRIHLEQVSVSLHARDPFFMVQTFLSQFLVFSAHCGNGLVISDLLRLLKQGGARCKGVGWYKGAFLLEGRISTNSGAHSEQRFSSILGRFSKYFRLNGDRPLLVIIMNVK
jgi:hypothetical protein